MKTVTQPSCPRTMSVSSSSDEQSLRRVSIGHADLDDGDLIAVEVEGKKLAVCRIGGEYRAFEDRCPHMDWPLTEGYIVDDTLYCSLHLASFDPKTGSCLGPPASNPLCMIRIAEEEGELVVYMPNPTSSPPTQK